MFSMCSELTPRARISDTRIPQLMQPWLVVLVLVSQICRAKDGKGLEHHSVVSASMVVVQLAQ